MNENITNLSGSGASSSVRGSAVGNIRLAIVVSVTIFVAVAGMALTASPADAGDWSTDYGHDGCRLAILTADSLA